MEGRFSRSTGTALVVGCAALAMLLIGGPDADIFEDARLVWLCMAPAEAATTMRCWGEGCICGNLVPTRLIVLPKLQACMLRRGTCITRSSPCMQRRYHHFVCQVVCLVDARLLTSLGTVAIYGAALYCKQVLGGQAMPTVRIQHE
jgi:hypothetical protein